MSVGHDMTGESGCKFSIVGTAGLTIPWPSGSENLALTSVNLALYL